MDRSDAHRPSQARAHPAPAAPASGGSPWFGLALVALLTLAATALARLPGVQVVGPLVVALFVGIAWRAAAGLPRRALPGVRFAAKPLLKLGIVLLGVRLDLALLASVGPLVVVTDLVVVFGGLVAVAAIGAALGVPRPVRLLVAVGTAVCGASAIVAALPLLARGDGGRERAADEAAGVAVATISLLGTLAVVGFVLLAAALPVPEGRYGLLVGATLQEVAQVVAAGYAPGTEAGDLALLTKLTRVALLAPALLLLGLWLRRGERGARAPGRDAKDRAPLLPPFLIGFALLGATASFGLVPDPLIAPVTRSSLALTAAAMTAIGLQTDLGALRRAGLGALAQGALGFVLLLGVALGAVAAASLLG